MYEMNAPNSFSYLRENKWSFGIYSNPSSGVKNTVSFILKNRLMLGYAISVAWEGEESKMDTGKWENKILRC